MERLGRTGGYVPINLDCAEVACCDRRLVLLEYLGGIVRPHVVARRRSCHRHRCLAQHLVVPVVVARGRVRGFARVWVRQGGGVAEFGAVAGRHRVDLLIAGVLGGLGPGQVVVRPAGQEQPRVAAGRVRLGDIGAAVGFAEPMAVVERVGIDEPDPLRWILRVD